MKSVRVSVAIGLVVLTASLVLAGSAFTQPARTLPVSEIKSRLKSKIPAALEDAIRELRGIDLLGDCRREFDVALAEARTEKEACLSVDNPPAGSPFAKFFQDAARQPVICVNEYRADGVNEACIDALFKDQAIFCAKGAAKATAKAKAIRSRCEAAAKKCLDTRDEVSRRKTEIEQLKRQLQVAEAALRSAESRIQTDCP
jgi:hypothetical protein